MAPKAKMIENPKDIQPTHNNVCVIEFEPDHPGLIIAPGTSSSNNLFEVVAVGPGLLLPNGQRGKMQVAVGDIVAFGTIMGHDVWAGGRAYHIASEEHIVAKVGTVHTIKRRPKGERIVLTNAAGAEVDGALQ